MNIRKICLLEDGGNALIIFDHNNNPYCINSDERRVAELIFKHKIRSLDEKKLLHLLCTSYEKEIIELRLQLCPAELYPHLL